MGTSLGAGVFWTVLGVAFAQGPGLESLLLQISQFFPPEQMGTSWVPQVVQPRRYFCGTQGHPVGKQKASIGKFPPTELIVLL